MLSSKKVIVHDDLEKIFEGRLRSICVITDMAPKKDYKHPYLNYLIHHANVISFDLNKCLKDGLIEAVYCKDTRKTVLTNPIDENIYKINNIDEIDMSSFDWDLCGKDEYISFSPWATIKHYFIVLTKGYIPPEYISFEVDRLGKKRESTSHNRLNSFIRI